MVEVSSSRFFLFAFVFLLFFAVGEKPFSCWAEESKEESDDDGVVRSIPVTFGSGSETVAKTTIEGKGLR